MKPYYTSPRVLKITRLLLCNRLKEVTDLMGGIVNDNLSALVASCLVLVLPGVNIMKHFFFVADAQVFARSVKYIFRAMLGLFH